MSKGHAMLVHKLVLCLSIDNFKRRNPRCLRRTASTLTFSFHHKPNVKPTWIHIYNAPNF